MFNPRPVMLLAGAAILTLPAWFAAAQNSAPPKPAPPASSSQSGEPADASTATSLEAAPDAAWSLLMQGANSGKLRDRSDAISALTILGRDRRAIAVISNGLDDKEETIRVLSATSLGEIKARPAIPKLKTALDDKSPQVSFAVAQALWKMGDRSGREIFYDVLDGERKVAPDPVKQKIRQARVDMHDPKALALIGVNEVSGAFLGPFSMGVSMVEEYAKGGGTSVQALSAQMLSSDGTPETAGELTFALSDKNWTVRAAAVRAVAKLGHRDALPQLQDMMQNDKSQPARFAAAAAIIHLSGPSTKKVPAHSKPPQPSPAASPQTSAASNPT